MKYRHEINRAKMETWRTFVIEADERTIWQVKKHLNATTTTIYVLTLHKTPRPSINRKQKSSNTHTSTHPHQQQQTSAKPHTPTQQSLITLSKCHNSKMPSRNYQQRRPPNLTKSSIEY